MLLRAALSSAEATKILHSNPNSFFNSLSFCSFLPAIAQTKSG